MDSVVVNRKRWAVFGLCFFVLLPTARGDPAAYRQAFEELRDAVYDCQPLERIEASFPGAFSLVQAEQLAAQDRLYWLSRMEYMLGRAYQNREDKKQAAEHYQAGLDYARRALELGEFSEGWRMMAENQGQLCLVKELAYLLANGPKGPQYAQKALKQDPRNVAAQVYLAAAKVYPPALAGGNPARGVELLQRALALQPTEKDDLFNIYSGIGVALGKLGRNAEASVWLRKALELYPNNAYVRGQLGRLGGSSR
jgi:tetratricopeptide (TPR) repeat protein